MEQILGSGEIQKVIPSAQHTACGKEDGLTAHVERWNNTLRQRLARLVRKTLPTRSKKNWGPTRQAQSAG